MNRVVSLLLFLAAVIVLASPVMAESFSGMVIDVSVYSLIVKNGDKVKIFQIRPETKGDRYPQQQNFVQVDYRIENGILIATHITITKK